MGHILIIDDEVELMQMVAFQLKTQGHVVNVCGNGVEGLEYLKLNSPDLIILDLNMPQMGGIEFYQRICAGRPKPAYPILVLTARANMENLFKDFDVDGFMIKPFDIQELMKQAESIMKRYQRVHRNNGFGFGRTKKITVVEDSLDMMDRIATSLIAAGYGVLPCTSGHQAQDIIPKDLPDAILIKLGMSDISGDVLALQLKTVTSTAHIPVYLYTPRNKKHDPKVLDQIQAKQGMMQLIEFSDSLEIIDVLDKYFSQAKDVA